MAGKTGGNFVGSALSAHLVLSMAAYGAGGNTAKEMRQALRLPADDAQAHLAFRSFIQNLNVSLFPRGRRPRRGTFVYHTGAKQIFCFLFFAFFLFANDPIGWIFAGFFITTCSVANAN